MQSNDVILLNSTPGYDKVHLVATLTGCFEDCGSTSCPSYGQKVTDNKMSFVLNN